MKKVDSQFLWQISGNVLSKPSYLLATHPLIDKSQIQHIDKIVERSRKADIVIGETANCYLPALQTRIKEMGIFVGETLSDYLSEEEIKLIDTEFYQLMGVGMDLLKQFKPFLLENIFFSTAFFQSNGIIPTITADFFIMQKAKENNMEVVGLETLDQRMNVFFHSIPIKRQAEILVTMIRNKRQIIEKQQKIAGAFLGGDWNTLESLTDNENNIVSHEKEMIIQSRNKAWLKQLLELIDKQSCFIVLGYSYLFGKQGIIAELRNVGYCVNNELY